MLSRFPLLSLMRSVFRSAVLAIGLAVAANAADIVSSGDWYETITAANLSAGAGSDLVAQIESVSGVTTLTISNAPGAWSLVARRSSTTWHADLAVSVKRVSDGSGSGSIAGGAAYVELTGSDIEIFTGTEDRSDISLQLKLTGLSKDVAPDTYASSIIFTVL